MRSQSGPSSGNATGTRPASTSVRKATAGSLPCIEPSVLEDWRRRRQLPKAKPRNSSPQNQLPRERSDGRSDRWSVSLAALQNDPPHSGGSTHQARHNLKRPAHQARVVGERRRGPAAVRGKAEERSVAAAGPRRRSPAPANQSASSPAIKSSGLPSGRISSS